MVNGQWLMVGGQWGILDGRWLMLDLSAVVRGGERRWMLDGRWLMVDGRWLMGEPNVEHRTSNFQLRTGKPENTEGTDEIGSELEAGMWQKVSIQATKWNCALAFFALFTSLTERFSTQTCPLKRPGT